MDFFIPSMKTFSHPFLVTKKVELIGVAIQASVSYNYCLSVHMNLILYDIDLRLMCSKQIIYDQGNASNTTDFELSEKCTISTKQ